MCMVTVVMLFAVVMVITEARTGVNSMEKGIELELNKKCN